MKKKDVVDIAAKVIPILRMSFLVHWVEAKVRLALSLSVGDATQGTTKDDLTFSESLRWMKHWKPYGRSGH